MVLSMRVLFATTASPTLLNIASSLLLKQLSTKHKSHQTNTTQQSSNTNTTHYALRATMDPQPDQVAPIDRMILVLALGRLPSLHELQAVAARFNCKLTST